jgi:hypothetical protein
MAGTRTMVATPVPVAEPSSVGLFRAKPTKHLAVPRGNVQSTPKGIFKIKFCDSFHLLLLFYQCIIISVA